MSGYNDQNTDTYEKISKINSAALINLRLNRLWMVCDLASATGELAKWNSFLDAVWRNLAADSKKEHLEEYNVFEEKLLSSNFFQLYKKKNGFEGPSEEEKEFRPIHYRILQEKHIFLKKVENEQGKGTAYRDEFEDDFE